MRKEVGTPLRRLAGVSPLASRRAPIRTSTFSLSRSRRSLRAQTKAARRPTIEYMETMNSMNSMNSASLLDNRDVRVVGVDRLRQVPAGPVHDLAQLVG
jgi:hypothetical protein